MKLNIKLTLIILLIALVSLGITGLIYSFNAEQALNRQVLNQLESVASIQRSRVESILAQNLERLVLVASRTQLRVNLQKFIEDPLPEYQDGMNRILVDAKGSIPDFIDISMLTLAGDVVASTNPDQIGRNYASQEFFVTGQAENRVDLFFLDDQGRLNVYLAGPLYLDEQLLGVIVIESTADNIVAAVSDYSGLGNTGETFLVREGANDSAVFLTPLRFDPGAALSRQISLLNTEAATTQALGGGEQLLTGVEDYRGEEVLAATQFLETPGWGLVVKIDRAEAFAPITQLRSSLFVAFFVTAFVLILATIYVANTITRPITNLTQVAEKIRQGDFSQRVEQTSQDEVGVLAASFNSMAAQLDTLYTSLEQRVVDRTQRLETIAVLSERLNAILNLDELLQEVVDLVKETFGYYHTHIYLMDNSKQELVVAAGTGSAGKEMKAKRHHISLNAPTSLVARTARTGAITSVDNVRASIDWLPNPLLPDTRSEMAVPIVLEKQVVGVLDVQQDKVGGLDEGDASLLRSLANQVAVAMRNANLFASVEKALAEARETQQRYVEQAWDRSRLAWQGVGQAQFTLVEDTALPETVIIEARQQALTHTEPVVVALTAGQPDTDDPASPANALHALVTPVSLQNIPIGNLQLHGVEPDRSWTEAELSLIKAVVDQVAQAAENLRLFEETRERAGREQAIREITNKLRTSPTLDILLETAADELSRQLGVDHTVIEFGIDAAAPAKNGNGTAPADENHR